MNKWLPASRGPRPVSLPRAAASALFSVLLLIGVTGFSPQTVGSASDGPSFKPQGELVFTTPRSGRVLKMITIQIADNDAQRAEGLMWRKYMPEDEGMLFIFDNQQVLSFWMKNTYIPLDMVFAEKNGTIVSIYADAAPLNENTISSDKPAQYVVEVNGGFCARYGINVGDKIQFER